MPDLDPTRIDLAHRLDAVLDDDDPAAVLPIAADPLAAFVSLAAEIRDVLHRPVLSEAERRRIHARTLDLVEDRAHAGLRLPWPQLGHRALHPAVLGGAAAAVRAVVGVAALQRRGHAPAGAAQAA